MKDRSAQTFDPRDLDRVVGHVVCDMRAQKGMTQKKLSLESGLTRQYISSVERGQQSISFCKLYFIAKGLGIKCSKLISILEEKINPKTDKPNEA